MGNYYSTILNDRFASTMPYSWNMNGYHSDHHQTKSPVIMSPKMQRLDSIGEDVNDTHFQPLAYGSVDGISSKIVLQPTMPRTRSMAISVTSNACGLNLRRANCTGYRDQLVKSYSLPEVGSNFTICAPHVHNKSTIMHSQVNHKPNRSWSVGSYGDERTMYQDKPIDDAKISISYKARLFNTSSECLKLAACGEQTGSNSQRCKSSNGSVELDNSDNHVNSEATMESESYLKSFCSSAKSRLVQCKETYAPFSTNRNNMADNTNNMTKDADASAPLQQSIKQTVQIAPVQASSPRDSSLGLEYKEVDSICDHGLSAILFSPRKTKKGRPSSKKQKKRKRQKQKPTSKAQLDTSLDSLHDSVDNAYCGDNVQKCELSNSVINFSNDSNSSLSQNVSTPVKSPSRHPIVHWFLSTTTSSECEDSESDEDEHSDSSIDEGPVTACISPINGHTFGISHNLDSIFKQKHVPSLESLLSSDCSDDSIAASPSRANSSDQSVSVIFSDGEDGDISIEFAAFSPSPMQPVSQSEASGPVEDDDSLLDSIEIDNAVDLGGINSKWDEMYSSPGCCNCCNKNSAGVASGPSMKVQFPEEPALSTVYTIVDMEGEDRAGMWHHYALDRERFQRRIAEASQVLSPVLEEIHRSAIVKRNTKLLRLHCLENVDVQS